MFLLLFSLFLYEEEPEPVKKSTWSRSRSKVDRLRNTVCDTYNRVTDWSVMHMNRMTDWAVIHIVVIDGHREFCAPIG